MPPAGLEPTIPAGKRSQIHFLDLAATGIDLLELKPYKSVDLVPAYASRQLAYI
jgi:hypothetical protein